MINNKNTENTIKKYISLLIMVIYGVFCFYLYYNQLIFVGTGRFEADTPVHVSMAVDDGFYYSITAFIYLICSKFSFENVLIALFLALVTIVSVPLTQVLINDIFDLYGKRVDAFLSFCLALFANFFMGFYIRLANVQHYIGYQNANMWHNSTYLCMKPLALISLILYLRIYRSGKRDIKQLIVFSGVLAISAGIKPSFITVFAPVMALELLYDLFKGNKFIKVFAFGCTVIPSLLVILWQSMVLFGNDTGNGYSVSPFAALSQRGDHPKVTLILSVLFPLFVFVSHINDFYKDRLYTGSLLVWLFGFLEVFLFTETGTRGGDGNFMWGYSVSLFIVFLTSAVKVYKDFISKRYICNNKIVGNISFVILGIIALWHTISGVWYFALLLSGVTYFI